MEFQFKHLLLAAVERAGSPISELPPACLPGFSTLEVGGVPRSVSAEISSPLCFWMSSRAARESEGLGLPVPGALSLAHCLLEALPASECWGMRCELGGDGHINGTPTHEFLERYISVVFERGVSLMFATDNLFSDPQMSDPQTWCFSGSALLDRVSAESQEELELLGSRTGDFDVDDWVMVLALQMDQELDVRPYVDNSLGRQNVPWYLRRGLQDLQKVLEAFAVVEVTSGGIAEAYGISERIGVSFVSLLASLVRVRARYQRARISERPELIITSLLTSLRAFYAFYNDPSFRRVLFDPSQLQSQAAVRDAVQVLRDLIISVMGLLEFPCGNKSFVLHL